MVLPILVVFKIDIRCSQYPAASPYLLLSYPPISLIQTFFLLPLIFSIFRHLSKVLAVTLAKSYPTSDTVVLPPDTFSLDSASCVSSASSTLAVHMVV